MESAFTKIGSYLYSSEAVIVKGRLEAEGIEVVMADNYTIDTDPLVSNAIGGVKLFVKTEQAQQAWQILAEISRYSVNDEGVLITCPECGANEVELGSTIKDLKSFFAFLFMWLTAIIILPFYTKYKYRCNKCGYEFNMK